MLAREFRTEAPRDPDSAEPPFWRRLSPEFWMVTAALVFRIVLLLRPHALNDRDDISLINEISNISASLAAGHGFASPFGGSIVPTAWIPPIYPFLCSLWLRAFGAGSHGVVAILAMNSLFSAFTCIPLFRAAEKLFDRQIAMLSGWTFALLPYFARWPVTWFWEITLSTLFMTWLFWRVLVLREEDTLRNWVGFGLIWGFAMLTNPSVMTLVGLSMLWLLQYRGLRIWKHVAVAVLVCGVVISPWLVRNRIVLHHWIFIRSNFGFEFSLGNYHGSAGDCWMGHHPWTNPSERQSYADLGEAEYISRTALIGKQFIRNYPEEFLRLCWFRFRIFWDGGVMRMRPEWRPFWLAWLYPLLTITTALGLLVMLARRLAVTHLMFFTILLYPWPYYLDCVQSRFRHLVDPMMLMISMYLIVETVRIVDKGIRLYSQRAGHPPFEETGAENSASSPPEPPQAPAPDSV